MNIKSVGLSHQEDTWSHSNTPRAGSSTQSTFPCVDRFTAQNKPQLVNLGITHVLNAAHGPRHIDTGPRFYSDANIEYHGVEASDCKDFDLGPFFRDAAEFIHVALRQQGSAEENEALKELVLCSCGSKGGSNKVVYGII